jgi:ankyrin repeat protein
MTQDFDPKQTKIMLHAARDDQPLIMLAAIENGADINAQDHLRNTALIYQAGGGHVFGTRELLSRGANPDLPNRIGNTAAHVALKRRQYYTLEVLVERGANLNLPDANGETVRDLANSNYEMTLFKNQKPKAAEKISAALIRAIETKTPNELEILTVFGDHSPKPVVKSWRSRQQQLPVVKKTM